MERRVAQGPAAPGPGLGAHWLDLVPSALIGFGLFALALWVYWWPGNERYYDHFVWQALAFLDGRAAIEWPVPGNEYFQDVYPLRGPGGEPTGYALLPFPPLPALVLLPVVALYGIATDEQAVSVVLGAVDVVLCWWMLGRLAVSRDIRLAVTVFFAFGTVFWYSAQLGTTWYFAHVVAIGLLLLALGLALGGDGTADEELDDPPGAGGIAAGLAALRRPLTLLDGRQFVVGLLFGLACTARLSILVGAPFFMLVGSGGTWLRRSVSAGLGAAIPVSLLLAYNLTTTGEVFHPGYEYQYQLEAYGWRELGYNADWAIEDPRYIPQNAAIAFLSAPVLFPTEVPMTLGGGRQLCTDALAARGLFDEDCPIALPRDIGMSVILTSPAYLLGLAAAARAWRSRLAAGAVAAILGIGLLNLMHFSQGWVQFGYRFANDIVVFALPLVALGIARRGGLDRWSLGLIAVSLAVNHWGVTWGNMLGW